MDNRVVTAPLWRELADPYCLRETEAGTLLAGHPWRRFVVIGDSVAQGIGDPVGGYSSLSWTDRVAAELAANAPELAYLNLGRRDLRADQVRVQQLPAALAFKPDLAMLACGANDALRSDYQPHAVDAALEEMIVALRDLGADVITVGLFDTTYAPMLRPLVKPVVGARMRLFSARTAQLAAGLGTIHVNMTGHPVQTEPDIWSADGLHGNLRAHAICAADTIRRLGDHLGNTWRG